MKTITSITGQLTTTTAVMPVTQSSDVHSTQSQVGFWRRARMNKSGVIMESSKGGSVLVPFSEIWKMVEPHDANLVMPAKVPPTKPN